MITLHDLTMAYGSHTLISRASAEIASGRLVALIGRNGSGKSTLLRAISGQKEPASGSITIDGKDLHGLRPLDKARLISFVTTERVRISDMCCRDVVGLGRAPYTDWIGRLTDADREIVDNALRLTGMEAWADRSLDSMSDGECQRVMIARALAQTTPVMLLDEPTSFLDLPNRYHVCMLLRDLAHAKAKTIIFSTHELDIALDLCDDIVLIDTPQLVTGTPAQVMATGAIERLFSVDGLSPAPRRLWHT